MPSSLDERARKKGKWIACSDPSTSNYEADTSLMLKLTMLTPVGKTFKGTFEETAISTTDIPTSDHEKWDSTVGLQGRFGKEGTGMSHLDPSSLVSSSDREANVYDTLVPADECLWGMLPEDILELILMRLMVSTRCRFRSVCRKWKQDLDSLPYLSAGSSTHMILSRSGNRSANFFCHSARQWFTLTPKVFYVPPVNLVGLYPSSEKSWELRRHRYHENIAVDSSVFTIPSNVNQSAGPHWELVDVDAGLLCYQREVGSTHWLCVSNPLTSFCEIVIPPDDNFRSQQYATRHPVWKLLVDLTTKTFKVIAMVDRSNLTAVYDSSTSIWRYSENHNHISTSFWRFTENRNYIFSEMPDWDQAFGHKELFVWRNKIFVYETKQYRYRSSIDQLAVFNVESGRWTWHNVKLPQEFPRGTSFDTHIFILSDEEQVKLVQFSFERRPFFSVWKLPNNDLNFSISDQFSQWQKIIPGSSRAIGRGIGSLAGYRVARVCYGKEFISFIFRSNQIKNDFSRTHKCARYSFATTEWSVVPCPAGFGGHFRLFHWKPSLDIKPRAFLMS